MQWLPIGGMPARRGDGPGGYGARWNGAGHYGAGNGASYRRHGICRRGSGTARYRHGMVSAMAGMAWCRRSAARYCRAVGGRGLPAMAGRNGAADPQHRPASIEAGGNGASGTVPSMVPPMGGTVYGGTVWCRLNKSPAQTGGGPFSASRSAGGRRAGRAIARPDVPPDNDPAAVFPPGLHGGAARCGACCGRHGVVPG